MPWQRWWASGRRSSSPDNGVDALTEVNEATPGFAARYGLRGCAHPFGRARQGTRCLGFWPQFLAATGDAVDEILRIAKETKADLIVMGAKRMKSMADHKPHTKAYRIVSSSVCPVLTIRS